jgi:uncharacterized protein YecT (DUF1311 family)
VYRDKQCAFETAGPRDGTIHPIEVSICLTAKTQTHVEELAAPIELPRRRSNLPAPLTGGRR